MNWRCVTGVNIKEGQCLHQPAVQRVLESNRTVFIKGESFLKGCVSEIRALDPERDFIHIKAVFKDYYTSLFMLHVYCKSCFFSWFVSANGNWKVNYLCEKKN